MSVATRQIAQRKKSAAHPPRTYSNVRFDFGFWVSGFVCIELSFLTRSVTEMIDFSKPRYSYGVGETF
jgi:hypothetical protein